MIDEAAQGDASRFRIDEEGIVVMSSSGDAVDEWLGVIKIGEA